MNFWETVLGHRLAETLIRELPKLAEATQKPRQHVAEFGQFDLVNTVKAIIDNGGRIVAIAENVIVYEQ